MFFFDFSRCDSTARPDAELLTSTEFAGVWRVAVKHLEASWRKKRNVRLFKSRLEFPQHRLIDSRNGQVETGWLGTCAWMLTHQATISEKKDPLLKPDGSMWLEAHLPASFWVVPKAFSQTEIYLFPTSINLWLMAYHGKKIQLPVSEVFETFGVRLDATAQLKISSILTRRRGSNSFQTIPNGSPKTKICWNRTGDQFPYTNSLRCFTFQRFFKSKKLDVFGTKHSCFVSFVQFCLALRCLPTSLGLAQRAGVWTQPRSVSPELSAGCLQPSFQLAPGLAGRKRPEFSCNIFGWWHVEKNNPKNWMAFWSVI